MVNGLIVEKTLVDPDLSSSAWSNLLGTLPQSLRKSASRYRFDIDQQRHILGRLLLFRALKARGHHWEQVHSGIEYNVHRRPFLGGIPGDFNISHSGEMVICAVSDQGLIGADVEKIRMVEFSDFKRTMNSQQWEVILNNSDPLKMFFQFWAIKESTIKADGRGLQMKLTEIQIEEMCTRYETQRWHYQVLPLGASYCGAIAGTTLPQEIQVVSVDAAELWDNWL